MGFLTPYFDNDMACGIEVPVYHTVVCRHRSAGKHQFPKEF